MNTFVAVAYDDAWYLGQIVEILSPGEAVLHHMKRVGQKYFQWPRTVDRKATSAIYVVQDNLSISPMDSGLHIWQLSSSPAAEIDEIYKDYNKKYMQ